MTPELRGKLKDLLVKMFKAEELGRLVWRMPGAEGVLGELPDPHHIGPSKYVTAVIAELEGASLLNRAFFALLVDVRQNWETDIRALERDILGDGGDAGGQATSARVLTDAAMDTVKKVL